MHLPIFSFSSDHGMSFLMGSDSQNEYDKGDGRLIPSCKLVKIKAKSNPPYGLKIFKGYKNVMIRRDFANFLIFHPVAKAFEEFLHDTIVPDEHLYATLARITDVKPILDERYLRTGNKSVFLNE